MFLKLIRVMNIITEPECNLLNQCAYQDDVTINRLLSTCRTGMINLLINRYWKFFWLSIISLWYQLC